MKLTEVYNDLILEVAATRERVMKVIDKKWRVVIYYEGDPIINKGWRIIEPYAFGLSKAGNPVIRAYQQDPSKFGLYKYATATDTVIPAWKMFRLDRISQWREVPGPGMVDPQTLPADDKRRFFNPNGDKSMLKVFKIAKFDKYDYKQNQDQQTQNQQSQKPGEKKKWFQFWKK